MAETNWNDWSPRRLLWSVFFLVLKGLFYCWLVRALYLFIYDDFIGSHALLARAYLAARDGLYDLPQTLWFLAGLVAAGIGWLHGTLIGQLGYDPVALPALALPSPAGVSPDLLGFLQPAMRLALLLGVVQFMGLFLLAGRRGTLVWAAPGLPLILVARLRLAYWAVTLGLTCLLVWITLAQSLLAALLTAVTGLVCLRWPLLAGLPLWLLDKGLGISPDLLLRLPAAVLRGLLDLAEGAGEARTGSGARGDADFSDRARATREDEDAAYAPPEAQDTDSRYRAACASFALEPGAFAESELRSRYRELMRKVHPDRQGSARLAALINADYEFVLSHHGWRR